MFQGAKILVVEDDCLLAEVVCAFVSDCGMSPIGPAAGLERGMVFAHQAPLDGAILDIGLHGQLSFPICTVLLQRGTVPMVPKPFEDDEMRIVIEAMLAGKVGGPLIRTTSAAAKASPLQS